MSATYSHALLITGARTWDDELAMRQAFNAVWRIWGPDRVERPLLISGHASQGADAMAERIWRDRGFDVLEMPADWGAHGRRAGVLRNTRMVELAVQLREQGSGVLCAAFLDLCRRRGCPQGPREQLAPARTGHFSHGTIHCRAGAAATGLPVLDIVLGERLPRF